MAGGARSAVEMGRIIVNHCCGRLVELEETPGLAERVSWAEFRRGKGAYRYVMDMVNVMEIDDED